METWLQESSSDPTHTAACPSPRLLISLLQGSSCSQSADQPSGPDVLSEPALSFRAGFGTCVVHAQD